ncbi:hypothetical protein QE152_g16960 [Popillia japonica]|uniref:Uncharacterized protein n=1 Tax=Popillia japonica TaxID=7064 RepID=A0AAW1L3H2_POPJA
MYVDNRAMYEDCKNEAVFCRRLQQATCIDSLDLPTSSLMDWLCHGATLPGTHLWVYSLGSAQLGQEHRTSGKTLEYGAEDDGGRSVVYDKCSAEQACTNRAAPRPP